MTMAISMAVDEGAKAVVCASTGNTSASAAAYASRAGLACVVLIPDGHIALGKLAQALMHGARVLQVRGQLRPAPHHRARPAEPRADHRRQLGQPAPDRGADDRAFEIVDVLGDAPDVHCIPVGNAGNISAYWRGYLKYKEAGRRPSCRACWDSRPPAPRPSCWATRSRTPRPSPPRSASGTRPVGTRPRPPRRESGGSITAVTDEEIMDAYTFLAQQESVFCEAASSASVAGLIKNGRARGLHRGVRVDRARAQGPRPRHQGDLGPLGDRPQARVGPGRDLPVEGDAGLRPDPLTCRKAGCVGMSHRLPLK